MVDLTRLEAVCQKKLNARVLQEIRDTVEHIPDDETGDLFWAGIKFLLQREKLIDEALAAEPEPAA